jgi:hypothetical protein
MSEDAPRPADTMRERAESSRVKLWLFLEAPRMLVVALVLGGLFVSLVAAGLLIPKAVIFLASGDPVETAFQAFIGATITGVTLVLTLNQLVLSQELGAVGDQRDRMEGAMQFREDVAALLDDPVTPPEPSAFFRALVGATADRADRLHDLVADDEDLPEDCREDVRALCDDVAENADSVTEGLTDAQFGTYDVLSAALNFNYSWKLYWSRRLREVHGDAFSDEQREALEDLVETVELFGPTREHFKTLYFQWELVDLSRVILAASLPALVGATTVLFYGNVTETPESILGMPVSILVVSAGVTVALLPFAVLLSYILRIATIAKRTLSIGPFTLRSTERSEDGHRD